MLHVGFAEPVPLELNVTGPSGGVTGLTVVVAIRDVTAIDNYLDFDDMTFKTSGWVEKQTAMTEVGGGSYSLIGGADPWLWIPRPKGPKYFQAEYEVSGSSKGISGEVLLLTQSVPGEDFDTRLSEVGDAGNDGNGWQEFQINQSDREIRRLNLYDHDGNRINVPPENFNGVIRRREIL